MDNFIEMTEEEWFETYKPIKNHIDTNASFDGHMFETYGDEVEFVKSTPLNRVWMYGDGDDGGSYIWNGWHIVNRIGYFITDVPCPENTTIQIKMSSYWYYCEGCGLEQEDDGQLINDKFYEYECCPQCATVEQLKEIEEANA
jgi:hypothetical protein